MKLPQHLHTFEGALYDTRKTNWTAKPIRSNYERAHRSIESVADLKATLRVKYAWPGGYEIVYLTSDGAILCAQCVRKNFRSVIDDIKQGSGSSGWRVVASTYEAVSAECARECDPELVSTCAHCSKEFGELA